LWPFTLLQDQLGYVLFAGLLGGGMLLARFLLFLRSSLDNAFEHLKIWLRPMRAMKRLAELTPQQQAALLWIAYHPDTNINGNPIEEPFRALCSKGFLTPTDDDMFDQAFKVNRRIYSGKNQIRALLRSDVADAIINDSPPWRWNPRI